MPFSRQGAQGSRIAFTPGPATVVLAGNGTAASAASAGVTGPPDLIVTDISWTPATPAPGDHVVFTANITNQGQIATPDGIVVDVLFTVTNDATNLAEGGRSWSDNNSTSLAAGASRTQTANGGDTSGYIVAGPVANYTVQAYVNGNNRFPEADRTNNFFDEPFIPVSAATVPDPPGNLAATPGDTLVALSWSFPADDGGAVITNYKLYRNNVLITSPDDAVLAYNDTAVVNGTTYTYTISAVNSVGEGAKSAGVTATPTAAVGAPTLPATLIVGAAAYKALFWGGFSSINSNKANFDKWKTAGFIGYDSAHSNPTDSAANKISGVGQLVFDTAQAGQPDVSGANYQWQRGWEGVAAAGVTGAQCGQFYYKKTFDPSYEAIIGQYISRLSYDGLYPVLGLNPFTTVNGVKVPTQSNPDLREGSWWNDTFWDNKAAPWYALLGRALKNVYGATGIQMDPEQGNWSTSSPTHTPDEHSQKTHDRAYQCGTAFWQAFPNGRVYAYQYNFGGWGQWLRGWYGQGNTDPIPVANQMAWYLGWMKAMCDFGGSLSGFMCWDRDFYAYGEGGMGGPSVDSCSAKVKLNNERIMATLSRDYPYGVGQTSWNRGCDRVNISPASWVGGSGATSEKPTSTPPAYWLAQQGVHREWGMAPYRVTYSQGMGARGGTNDPDGLFPDNYNDPNSATWGLFTTHVAGCQAGMDPTPIPTVAPTCTNLTWTGSTLACRAAHKYGVKYVRVYNGSGFNSANPEPSYLGAMRMTWTHPSLPSYLGTPGNAGGNASASYPTLARVADSYQDCTFTTAGSSGTWRVLKVVTVKDDVAWFRVQHP